MWNIIPFVILMVLMFVGFVSCRPQNTKNSGIENNGNDSIKGMFTREQLIQALHELAQSPPPENLSEGAMCYKMSSPPDRAEYVCPKCGEKTLWTDDQAWFLDRELGACRSQAASIKGIYLSLDESDFCAKCSVIDSRAPELCIEVRLEGETKNTRTCSINEQDMVILDQFLKGKDRYPDDYDFEHPLQKEMDRILTMLGIEKPPIK